MEVGTVFWIVIAYSIVGWFVFKTAVSGLLSKMSRGDQVIEISGRRLVLLGTLLFLGATISGPMTWGNAIRSFLLHREEASSE